MLEPFIFGDYPDEMKRTVGSRLPVFSKEESEQVKGSSDFIGIIHYLAASVTSIKIKPSISGNPDFYSDMGVSMTCRIIKLYLLNNKYKVSASLFFFLDFLLLLIISSLFYCFGGTVLGNFSAFEVRVSRLPNSDAKLLNLYFLVVLFLFGKVCCCSMGYGKCP